VGMSGHCTAGGDGSQNASPQVYTSKLASHAQQSLGAFAISCDANKITWEILLNMGHGKTQSVTTHQDREAQ
jgi:hypothetical protein